VQNGALSACRDTGFGLQIHPCNSSSSKLADELVDLVRRARLAGLVLAPPDEAWVNNMAVRRDHQRRGLGRALLEELLAIGRRHGAKHTLLEVAADNTPAQALYDAYGFEVIGLRKNYYQASGTDALVMRRSER